MQRILIVDDNDENIYYLQALLRSAGHEVHTARDGAEALNAALADPPELVISDLLMPIMDGFTLLRQWKADQRINRIPFIVYTATYTDPKDEKLALDLGADAFIVKPTEPAPFMARIGEVMAKAVRGDMSPANAPVGEEKDLLRQYSKVLIHKLESKALQLEEANRTLSVREAHLTAIIENSPNCITSIASDGTFLTMNETGLRMLEADPNVTLTNYGCFLERFPPEYEAEIVENTSWSCVHGIERWRSNCGCNGGKPGCNQAWRAPLRQALDELRDALVPLTESEGAKLFKDVWAARDGYIEAMLDHSPQTVEQFFRKHQLRVLTVPERVRGLELMEMQRHVQLMFTSCGWFFDDISGIESVQIITYAARALQLAREVFGELAAPQEPAFLARLAEARSNVAAAGDGAKIYKEQVSAKQLGLEQVAAHYAISSIFSSFGEETDLFCFRVWRNSYDVYTSGRGRLALGRVNIVGAITGMQRSFSFAVLHFGDQNITAAVKAYEPEDAASFEAFASQAAGYVQRADFPEAIRLLDRYYGHMDYSLTSLFGDEQRRIVQIILTSTLSDIESSLTTIYDDHASLLHFLSQAGLPKPPALTLAAGFAINAGLRRALESDPIDQPQLRSFLSLAKADQVPLETPTLSYIADLRMKRAMVDLQMSGGSLEMLERALTLARTLTELPFDLNLWQAQNIWYEILRTTSYALTSLAAEDRPQWDRAFRDLGTCLSIDCAAIGAQDPAAVTTGD